MTQHYTDVKALGIDGRRMLDATTTIAILNTRSYQAVCSCGYVGRVFDRKADANNDADEHVLCLVRANL